MNCQARVLDVVHTIPNTKLIYHTTTECGGEISKKLSIDSGDAHMNICSCCFRRYTEKGKPQWYGWFDGSYPPEAKVLGSKWYNEAVAASLVEPDESIEELEQQMEDMSLQAQPEAEPKEEVEPEPEPEPKEEVEPEPKEEVEAKVEPQAHIVTKASLKARIKELQLSAKPGKMSLKDIQAAFKEITNLKTQIHML
jgi:hypothetical protein